MADEAEELIKKTDEELLAICNLHVSRESVAKAYALLNSRGRMLYVDDYDEDGFAIYAFFNALN